MAQLGFALTLSPGTCGMLIAFLQDRSFTFILKTPPTAVLLKKAAGEQAAWGGGWAWYGGVGGITGVLSSPLAVHVAG